jgi:5'-methylthioadenosine phosphorylase
MHQNADNASKVVRAAVAAMAVDMTKGCACVDALKYAILTDRKVIPEETKQKLALLLDKYL